MKTLIFLSLIMNCDSAVGQQVVDVDKNNVRLRLEGFDPSKGKPTSRIKYVRLTSGSPFFSEDWMQADIYLTDSTGTRNLPVKLDLLEGSFMFINKKKEELYSDAPVLQIVLTDTATNKKYVFMHFSIIPNVPNKTWYQILTGEKFTLFKEYYKVMSESKPYGSSVTEQEIRTFIHYFIGFNDEMTRVKKFSDIIDLAGKKGKQLQEYINSNNLSMKKEEDIISLVDYYHTLN